MSAIRIGVIGDFDSGRRSHRATDESLKHAGATLDVDVSVVWLPTQDMERGAATKLEIFDALWCAPGSPYESFEGALEALRFARGRDRPLIGTCGGFQHVVLEYARSVLGFEEAQHAEYDPHASQLFITPLSCSLAGKKMRVEIQPDSRAFDLYVREKVEEQYYCNFGLNPAYMADIKNGGLRITGSEQDGEARIVELSSLRFFLATLFVPQISSNPDEPHPLITGFLKAAREFQSERRGSLRLNGAQSAQRSFLAQIFRKQGG